MPSIEPMAAKIEMRQQKTVRPCSHNHLPDHCGIFFCTMCIWTCAITKNTSTQQSSHHVCPSLVMNQSSDTAVMTSMKESSALNFFDCSDLVLHTLQQDMHSSCHCNRCLPPTEEGNLLSRYIMYSIQGCKQACCTKDA